MSPNLNSEGIIFCCWGVYWKTLRRRRSQLKFQAPLQYVSIHVYHCHIMFFVTGHAWSRQVPIMQRKSKPGQSCCPGSWPWQFISTSKLCCDNWVMVISTCGIDEICQMLVKKWSHRLEWHVTIRVKHGDFRHMNLWMKWTSVCSFWHKWWQILTYSMAQRDDMS